MGHDIDIEFERHVADKWTHVGTAWDLGWFPGRNKTMFAALTSQPWWTDAPEPTVTKESRECPTDATARTRDNDDFHHPIQNHFMATEFVEYAIRRREALCEWSQDLDALLHVVENLGDPGTLRMCVVTRH